MSAPRYMQTLFDTKLHKHYQILDTYTNDIVCLIPYENRELVQPILDKLNSL